MEVLLEFASQNPLVATATVAALAVGGYMLLNRRSAAARDAERRLGELQAQNRNRYRQLRAPK